MPEVLFMPVTIISSSKFIYFFEEVHLHQHTNYRSYYLLSLTQISYTSREKMLIRDYRNISDSSLKDKKIRYILNRKFLSKLSNKVDLENQIHHI